MGFVPQLGGSTLQVRKTFSFFSFFLSLITFHDDMYPSASEPLQLMLSRVYERTDNITDLQFDSCFLHCNYHGNFN